MSAQRRALLPTLLLAALGALLAVVTWRTWLDGYIDFGRELYVPWQLTEGGVLYRDIAYFNGPLSPYWNALLFAVFGTGIGTLVAGNLAVIAVVTAVLYRLVVDVSDRLTATVAGGVFLFVFCFGQLDGSANFNWTCPYSHEMTHGIALALLAVLALVRWLRTASSRCLVLAGVLTGLVFLTKPEVFAACLLAALTALVLARRRRVRTAVVLAGAACVAPLVALGLLATQMPLSEAGRGVLGGWPYVFDPELRQQWFYRSSMGVDAPLRRLVWVVGCAFVWSLMLGPAFLATKRLRAGGRRRLVVAGGLAVALFVVCSLVAFFGPFGEPLWRYAYLALPLGVAAVAVARSRALGSESHGARAALVLAALAIGLLAKMILNARVSNYGFGLAVPAVVLCVVALFHWIPRSVARSGGFANGFRMTAFAVIALIALGHGVTMGYWLTVNTRPVGQGRDRFYTNRRGPALQRMVDRLAATRPDETVLVLPEGVTLNYLARRVNPTPFVNFMPPELVMFGEDTILAALRSSPPDYVVLLTRRAREYGEALFGTHYGESILEWVEGSYERIAGEGPEPLHPDRLEDREWGIWLLRRR